MRLHKHLNESNKTPDDLIAEHKLLPWENVKKMLEKDCSKYINEFRRDRIFWRGTKDLNPLRDGIVKLKPRKNRHPKDVGRDWHMAADEWFDENFGWKPRSQGIFAIKKFSYAQDYGTPFMFFPIGNYKYVWTNQVDDFHTLYTLHKHDSGPTQPGNKFNKLMDEVQYKDTDAKMAYSSTEVTFGVNNYYMVHMAYFEKVNEMMSLFPEDSSTITRKLYGMLG